MLPYENAWGDDVIMVIPPRFRHFVLRYYDSDLPYDDIAKAIFESNHYLVVKEFGGKEHVHWQGVTSKCEASIEKLQQTMITQQHRLRKEAGSKCRLIANKSHDATALGFQYMSKEKRRVVLASSGFSEQDLLDLYESSVQHVEKLKTDYNKAIWTTMEKEKCEVPKTKEQFTALLGKVKRWTQVWYKRHQKNPPFSRLTDKCKQAIIAWPKMTDADCALFDMF